MRALMLSPVVVLIQLNLYIFFGVCSLRIDSNYPQQNHVRTNRFKYSIHDSKQHSQPTSTPTTTTTPAASAIVQLANAALKLNDGLNESLNVDLTALQSTPSPSNSIMRDNKMDDVFFDEKSNAREDTSGQQYDHRNQYYLEKKYSHSTTNLDNSLEQVEMFTNNHQSTTSSEMGSLMANPSSTSSSTGQNSRHYNSFQLTSNSVPSQHNNQKSSHLNSYYNHLKHQHHHQLNQNQNYHYGKYSPNIFSNNYNLNYIHSLLSSKSPNMSPSPQPPTSLQSSQMALQQPATVSSSSQPSPSSSPLSQSLSSSPPSLTMPQSYPYSSMQNLMNSNPNGLNLGAYGPLDLVSSSQSGSSFASAYISASSALSAAVNNFQQSLAQKQHHQISNVNNHLEHSVPAETDLDPQPLSIQIQPASLQNITVGDMPGASICGRQQVASRESRVVGGNRTYEGEFPWAVSIQRHGNHHCGGVIVGPRWILTAAHCVRSQLVGNLLVRTGGSTLSRLNNGISSHLERDYTVENIVMHDDFSRYDNLTASQLKSSANTNNADIALIKLKHDIHLNELAWPVCLPNRGAGNFSGHDATVIGWGKLNEKSEEFSNELQKVKLTIIDNKVCQNWFRQAGRDMPIDDRIICAGFKNGGKDACHGDSGGPLLSRINGRYVVVGVVSTGIGCARPLLPGLYSRVSSYINWIERYITN